MNEHVIELTDDNFEQQIEGENTLALVDFWAPWCAPCKALNPVIEQLAEKYADKAKIGKVNADECKELTRRFGVRGLPTILLLKNGKVVNNVSRLQSLSSLSEAIEGELIGQSLQETIFTNLENNEIRSAFLLDAENVEIEKVLSTSPEYLSLPLDDMGTTPVGMLLQHNKREKVTLLRKLGAQLSFADLVAGAYIEELKEAIVALSDKEVAELIGGEERLCRLAIFSDSEEVIELVFPKGLDINDPGEQGAHSIFQWVIKSTVNMMQVFAKKGMDFKYNWSGYTALHMCSRDIEKVKFLLAQGVDVHSKDVNGSTVVDNLHKAKTQFPEAQVVIDYLESL